jgi:3HB-oligomer hydrolase (3HBOH)
VQLKPDDPVIVARAGSSGAAAGARFSTISLSTIFIRLDGKPTIVVHRRNDDRVPVNFSSRPNLGLNDL